MPTVEERLAVLEARLDGMSNVPNVITELRGDMNARFTDISGRFTELRDDMSRRFTDVNRQFTELREDINRRFEEVNGRFGSVDRRFGDIDRRFGDVDRRFDEVALRLVALDEKGDRHFIWMVSTQVALLLAAVGALVGAYLR